MNRFVQNAARTIAFARHIPISRLTRRIVLEGKRRVLERTGAGHGTAPWQVSAAPPLPVFAPRSGKYERLSGGWLFCFMKLARQTGCMIDWNAIAAGPQNQLWRMNLHYMEYLEEAADFDFIDLVSQWIDGNPPFGHGYWRDSWNSYSISLRTAVWMQQLAARSFRLHESFRGKVLASLVQQLEFLSANLETDIGGNHLMKNIKALALAGAFFSDPRPRKLQDMGLALLDRELEIQILPDGVHYERSPSYHAQVLADLIEIRHALGRDPLGGRLDTATAPWRRPSPISPIPMVPRHSSMMLGSRCAICPKPASRRARRCWAGSPRRVRASPSWRQAISDCEGAAHYIVADCGRYCARRFSRARPRRRAVI